MIKKVVVGREKKGSAVVHLPVANLASIDAKYSADAAPPFHFWLLPSDCLA